MNYNGILAEILQTRDASGVSPRIDLSGDRFDQLLTGLAIHEAHHSDDEEAMRALLADMRAGDALSAVLFASELLVEVLAIESVHTPADIVAALRRQAVRQQAAARADKPS